MNTDFDVDSFSNSLTFQDKMTRIQNSEVNISMFKLYIDTITPYEGNPFTLN